MVRMRRSWMSWNQRNELWRRWHAGESLTDIAQALQRDQSRIFHIVEAEGGIAPAPRRRSGLALTLAEREEISRGVARGETTRGIARRLGRPPSTISREIQRHGGRWRYRARRADRRAWARARRPKVCRLATRPRLRRVVAAHLACQWSPQQIAGWLRMTFPSDPDMQVSHETIYRSLFVQSRGVLKRELLAQLRRQRRFRHARAAARVSHHPGRIVDAVSIRARPADVADRAVPGHWEGDLLIGGGKDSQVATLVERHSRYVVLVRVPHKDATTVARALARRVRRLPAGLMRSLTWDRGTELAQHQAFTLATRVRVYFCDPQSPWQRASNENTNGLLRQYLPKGTDLSHHTQAQLDAIAHRLNTRPRLTLGYQTPAAKLAQIVASTS
jgi:IS30 family transposase